MREGRLFWVGHPYGVDLYVQYCPDWTRPFHLIAGGVVKKSYSKFCQALRDGKQLAEKVSKEGWK